MASYLTRKGKKGHSSVIIYELLQPSGICPGLSLDIPEHIMTIQNLSEAICGLQSIPVWQGLSWLGKPLDKFCQQISLSLTNSYLPGT